MQITSDVCGTACHHDLRQDMNFLRFHHKLKMGISQPRRILFDRKFTIYTQCEDLA